MKLIITTDVGLEKLLCIDVENVLLLYSANISCTPLESSGVSVVLSAESVDPFHLVRIVTSRHVRGYWAIPIQRVCRASYEDVAKASIELMLLSTVKRPVKAVGMCRKRGRYIDSCTSLLRYVGGALESLGLMNVDFHDYEYILRVEVVYEVAGLTLYRKEDEVQFRIRKAT